MTAVFWIEMVEEFILVPPDACRRVLRHIFKTVERLRARPMIVAHESARTAKRYEAARCPLQSKKRVRRKDEREDRTGDETSRSMSGPDWINLHRRV